MTFERTSDYRLLNWLLTENIRLRCFLIDDFSPAPEDTVVVENPNLWYVVALDRGEPFGFYMMVLESPILWAFHTLMPLNARALLAMRELLGPEGWLWKNTPCLRAVTAVPASNRIAQRFGLRAGLKVYGENPHSFLKSGKLEAQVLMGASKPQELTHASSSS